MGRVEGRVLGAGCHGGKGRFMVDQRGPEKGLVGRSCDVWEERVGRFMRGADMKSIFKAVGGHSQGTTGSLGYLRQHLPLFSMLK